MRPSVLACLVGALTLGACDHPAPPASSVDAPGAGADAGDDVDGAVIVDAGPDGAATDGGGPDGGGPTPDARPPLTVEAMLAAACSGTTCTPSKVVSYWRGEWDTYAVRRTITFVDVSATEHQMVVTDDAGAPATLDFTAGVPVSLTVVNPGDTRSTGKHDVTAPRLFRAVAWRRVKSLTSEVRAQTFDSIHVRRRSGADLSAVLEFVPMNPGTFDLYCATGVPHGAEYEAIVAGTATADLADPLGHAGKGAKLTVTIATASPVSISYTPAALASDPRRLATDAVWAAGARDETYRELPVRLYEFTDEEYAFLPANLTLRAGVGAVVRLENPLEDVRAHAFAAGTLYASSVLRELQDRDIEIETSTLTAVQLLVGGFAELFFVPTTPGTYADYCDIGVSTNPDGSPKLTSGHAGRGMVGAIRVE